MTLEEFILFLNKIEYKEGEVMIQLGGKFFGIIEADISVCKDGDI